MHVTAVTINDANTLYMYSVNKILIDVNYSTCRCRCGHCICVKFLIVDTALYVMYFFLFLHRHITTLLEDVVFFVIGKESTGGLQRPNPLTEEGVIKRERQKLLREQYVLKEIFNLLSIPIKRGGENDLD